MHDTEHSLQRLVLGSHIDNGFTYLDWILPRFRELECITRLDWDETSIWTASLKKQEARIKKKGLQSGYNVPNFEHLSSTEFFHPFGLLAHELEE